MEMVTPDLFFIHPVICMKHLVVHIILFVDMFNFKILEKN